MIKTIGLFSIFIIAILMACQSTELPPTPDAPGGPLGKATGVFEGYSEPTTFFISPLEIAFTVGDISSIVKAYVEGDQFVYKYGYVLDLATNSWKQFKFSQATVGISSWIKGEATTALTILLKDLNINVDETKDLYAIAYACTKRDGLWDCHENKWMIRNFRARLQEELPTEPTAPGAIQTVNCTDSDGWDPYVRGKHTGLYNTGGQTGLIFGENPNSAVSGSIREDPSLPYTIYYDHCFNSTSSNQLNEGFCQTSDGRLMSTGYDCPYGCLDGACIKAPVNSTLLNETVVCTDSDNSKDYSGLSTDVPGNDIYIKGTAKSTTSFGQPGNYVSTDECIVNNIYPYQNITAVASCKSTDKGCNIREYFCSKINVPGSIEQASLVCPNGCSDGACIPATTNVTATCTDTDGGKNYNISGAATGNRAGDQGIYKDVCEDNVALKEFYCDTNPTRVVATGYICPISCSNGACSETPLANLPDLIIERVVFQKSSDGVTFVSADKAANGDKIKYLVDVKNIGTAAVGDFAFGWNIVNVNGGTTSLYDVVTPLSQLGPGATATFEIPSKTGEGVSKGNYTAIFSADSYNAINEISESNNKHVTTFVVE